MRLDRRCWLGTPRAGAVAAAARHRCGRRRCGGGDSDSPPSVVHARPHAPDAAATVSGSRATGATATATRARHLASGEEGFERVRTGVRGGTGRRRKMIMRMAVAGESGAPPPAGVDGSHR